MKVTIQRLTLRQAQQSLSQISLKLLSNQAQTLMLLLLLLLQPPLILRISNQSAIPIDPVLLQPDGANTATSSTSVTNTLDPDFIRSISVFHDSVSLLLSDTFSEYDLVVKSPTAEQAAAALHIYFRTLLQMKPQPLPSSDASTTITIRVDSQYDEDPPIGFKNMDILSLYPQMCVTFEFIHFC